VYYTLILVSFYGGMHHVENQAGKMINPAASRLLLTTVGAGQEALAVSGAAFQNFNFVYQMPLNAFSPTSLANSSLSWLCSLDNHRLLVGRVGMKTRFEQDNENGSLYIPPVGTLSDNNGHHNVVICDIENKTIHRLRGWLSITASPFYRRCKRQGGFYYSGTERFHVDEELMFELWQNFEREILSSFYYYAVPLSTGE
jgi:hypothetical protein